MYEEFYGLKEKPFSLTPDPRFFFLSENHRGAFEHVLYGIKEKEGFILITGEVGTGKTTLCRALLNRMESETVTSALILNPLFSGEELLRSILSDFGRSASASTKKELLDELNAFLLSQCSEGRSSILIIDEAQNLPLPVLEEIRILSNLETEQEKLLQIILTGQLELKEKLALPRLRQLNQRISIRYQLQPLSREEVPRYIQHRMTVAGSAGDIRFTAGALREIYDYSQGIPRLLNLACDRALLAGFAEQRREIGRQTVLRGLRSLQGEEVLRARGAAKGRLRFAALVLLVFFLGILFAAFFLDPQRAILRSVPGGNLFSAGLPASKEAQGTAFYTVQLGSYKSESEALKVAERVRATGYPLFLGRSQASDGGQHLLFLGKFLSQAEAEEVERTFKRVEEFSQVRVVLTSTKASRKTEP